MLIQFKFGHFLLQIEQFWPFEEISNLSHGGHLENRNFFKWPKRLYFKPESTQI
jgi:hypothetical protein